MDKKPKQTSSQNWSEIRSVLFRALPNEILSKENQMEWLTYHWNLVVGKEISGVSVIDRLNHRTLYVQVDEKEWLPVLDPLKNKIMQEINSRAGEPLLKSIVFNAVA